MKKRVVTALICLIAVILLISSAQAVTGAGNPVHTAVIRAANNLEYTNTVFWNSAVGRQSAFALKLTGAGDAYPIVMKSDAIYGGMTAVQMAEYAQGLGFNVLAAVNADFFSLATGVPLGIVIEDGVYKSSGLGAPALCFDNFGGAYLVQDPTVYITLTVENGDTSQKSVKVTNFNKNRTDTGGLYLFSRDFSTATKTSSDGWFAVFDVEDGIPTVSGTMHLTVSDVFRAEGEIELSEGQLVLTAAVGSGYGEEFEKFKPGDTVMLEAECSDPALIDAVYATGGGDVLISNGEITDFETWDKAIKSKAPRTAFGILSDGTAVSYVVDGRNYLHSEGLTLSELAEEMLKMGCVYAINLDGGGSSVLSLKLPGMNTAEVISKPSDGAPRKCSTYILYVTDKVSDGVITNLALQNNGAVVLSGSSVELVPAASDGGFAPVQVPEDIVLTSQGLGEISGMTYTAGIVPGTDILTLSSDETGAYGIGSVTVITSPTSIFATAPDSLERIEKIETLPGRSIPLTANATYYRMTVAARQESFVFSVTGDIGTIDELGQFTAGTVADTSGIITISAGDTKIEIPVKIGGFNDITEHWAREYIEHLYAEGIVRGVSETEYGPELEIKRGDFILMLYRAAGEPEIEYTSSFEDITGEEYYSKAVCWASALEIALGTGDGKFEPQQTLIRQQAFTFVRRALGVLGKPQLGGDTEILSEFADGDTVAEYAKNAVSALIELEVISGADGYLTPEASLTRAQMAKILSVVLMLEQI